MPYLVVCPNCGSKLKSGQPVPAGRSLSCPQCKGVFTLSAPAQEVDNPAAAAPPAPARPAPAASPPPTRPPSRGAADRRDIPDAEIVDADDDRPKSRSRRDEEADVRPRSRGRDDDDDDRPRSRRSRDDEDDDRPRSRRSRDDEDEDERPNSRRRPDDDEEDERPKSRRGRDEDDDTDERPKSRRGRDEDEDVDDERPKGKRARAVAGDDEDDDSVGKRRGGRSKSKKKKGLMIGLLAGVAALLLFCGGGAVMYFADPFGWFGGSSSDMLAWAPADTQAVMFMDVEGADKIDELRNELKADSTHTAKYGIKKEDLSAVLGAGRNSTMGADPDVMVVKLKKSADKTAIINSVGGTKAKANDKEYYKTRDGGALYFASDKMVVISKTESAVTGRLGKDEGKIVVTDELRTITKRGDGLMWIAATGQAAEQGDFIGMISALANMANMFAPGGKGFGPGGPNVSKPNKAKSTLMTMKASGSKATARFESTYDNADAANKVADDLRKGIDVIKSKGEPGTEVEVSTSGATVTLRMTGPIKKGKGMLPFGM